MKFITGLNAKLVVDAGYKKIYIVQRQITLHFLQNGVLFISNGKLFNPGRSSNSWLNAQIAEHNPLACKKW